MSEQNSVAAPGTTPAAEPTAQSVVSHGGITLSEAQLRSWNEQEVKAGRMTPEKSEAILAESGISTTTAERPDAITQYLRAEGFTPAAKGEFQLPLVPAGERMTPTVQQFDASVRGWLSEAKFTKEIGSHVAREVLGTHERLKDMSPAQREVWRRTERAKLERLHGGQTNQRIEQARQLAREVERKSPGLMALLEVTGAGDSAVIVTQFSLQAARLAAREG